MSTVATLIVARNAAQTVGDAIRSALAEPIDELLLVDDVSNDGTFEIASSFDDPRVRSIRLFEHKTLGYARGVGLAALESDFCFLLDADDVFLPGRVECLMGVLDVGDVGFVADEIELVDGRTGRFLRSMTIPAFMDNPPGLMRLFERNYLPGIGQIAFRVDAMREVGYDPSIHGAEDSDLVLRSLAAGVRGVLVRRVGYRMRHFPDSVSRNRERQAREVAKVLCKFACKDVRSFILKAGADELLAEWSVLSFAVFRQDYAVAGEILCGIERMDRNWDAVLEPLGPCPLSDRWRLLFAKGALALVGNREAACFWEEAAEIARLPEALNNLGVAYFRKGRSRDAANCFEEAVALNGGYVDALDNLRRIGEGGRVTMHPLRREPSRSEYS